MAAVGQTLMHGAGVQCRHLFGKAVFIVKPGSAWMRGFGGGDSKTARNRFLVCEWATAQADSHCLQPMQRSGCTKTVFMQLFLSPSRVQDIEIETIRLQNTSYLETRFPHVREKINKYTTPQLKAVMTGIECEQSCSFIV